MLLVAVLLLAVAVAGDISSKVVLPQGVLTGIELPTDRRSKVTAYLGIPYALPPLGPYRFAPPERHPGWNLTLVAEHFRPDCIQPDNTGAEDCLYLNVFVPQSSGSTGYPVIVYLEGQDFVSGSPRGINAHELAAEGVIVVTVSYRLNVFGFLCLGDFNSRGNLGLLDQYVALLWVRENALHFGGRADITLMGHGAGASSVVAHLTSPRTRGLFDRAVIMSGSILSPLLHRDDIIETSNRIASSLGCRTEQFDPNNKRSILDCLRLKTPDEILKGFDNFHKNANWTILLAPIADDFLPDRMQYLPQSPLNALLEGNFANIPIITGITSAEGSIILDKWSDLATQSDTSVTYFIKNTAIPNLLRATKLNGPEIGALVSWKYLSKKSSPPLQQLLELYGDVTIVSPHWKQVLLLSTSSQPVYVYMFNPRGRGETKPGGHGTELDFLFGAVRHSQWARGGKSSYTDERLSLMMKRLWTTFFRTGDPNPRNANRSLMWPPFSNGQSYLEFVSEESTGKTMNVRQGSDIEVVAFWNELLPSINNISAATPSQPETASDIVTRFQEDCAPYRNALFTTLFFLILLIVCLIVALFLLKRRSAGRQKSFLRQMPSVITETGTRHWRDNLSNYKL